MTGRGELPATYAFKTREGGMGILQIVGFTGKPKGVKIRYKMVQSAALATEVTCSGRVVDADGGFLADTRPAGGSFQRGHSSGDLWDRNVVTRAVCEHKRQG